MREKESLILVLDTINVKILKCFTTWNYNGRKQIFKNQRGTWQTLNRNALDMVMDTEIEKRARRGTDTVSRDDGTGRVGELCLKGKESWKTRSKIRQLSSHDSHVRLS
jgi:hypothetical protein